MLMRQKNHKQLNEQGFASIAIALVLIVVLSLLTIGFAQLARREQQSALNKQLANQAFYAAESGVNDADNAIKNGTLTTATTNVGTTNCLNLPLPGTTSADLNGQSGVTYSCVLVNLTPTSLQKDPPADGDWSTYFSTVGGPPASATLSWNSITSQSARQPYNNVNGFEKSVNWTAPAVLQFSITPLNDFTRNGLIANTFTVYAYPSTTTPGSTPVYSTSPDAQGKVIAGSCTAGNNVACHIQINGLPAASLYAIHVHDFYDGSHIVFNTHDALGNLLPLGDSQAPIYVPPKARDFFKRPLVLVSTPPPRASSRPAPHAQNL